MTKMDDRKREQLRVLTHDGRTAEQVAEILGVSARTVQRVRVQEGIPVSMSCPFSPGEIARVEAMLEDGCSYMEIARTIGRSAGSVQKHWPGRGWTMRQAAEQRSVIRRNGGVL